MRPKLRAGLLVLLAAVALASGAPAEDDPAAEPLTDKRRTLVLLLDGFRWDYIKHLAGDTSGFKEFLKNGVSAEYVNTIFPSLSFPAWTTISTGVYPETHGILANFFYNRQRQQAFMLNDTATTRKAFWWQSPEPVWTTAAKQGLRVATVLWSRSDVPVHGLRPEQAEGYAYNKDALGVLRDSIERSLEYLQRGFDLVMTYSELVDDVGHSYGPDSLEMKYTIGDVGKLLTGMFRSLETRNLKDKQDLNPGSVAPGSSLCRHGYDAMVQVGFPLGFTLRRARDRAIPDPSCCIADIAHLSQTNVILIGDHGMVTVDPGEPIRLREHLSPDDDVEQALGQGAFVSIYAKPGRVEYIHNKLASVRGLTVWRRGEVPRELHYNRNPALPDLIVSASKGYLIHGLHVKEETAPRPHGIHGYQPDIEEMRTIFYAVGPDFKRGVTVDPIDLVDEYQVLCHLLRIPAHPHNGTWSRVRGLLAGDPARPYGEGDEDDDDIPDLEPTPIRSTAGTLAAAPPPAEQQPPPAAPQGPAAAPAPPPATGLASGPVRIALSVIVGLVGWYVFLCVITNSH
ncbi:Glycerophosphocholine cholinephosphodiesterase ENPP6 [Frankliniella fusca]|uniref:Glycerophosphocholine cholinephosphodiesterase ENPP6 n=1 Tax=Frankliniella fusca TaxID=407009 RepID=A0AAE1GXA9_9NEOP|nr:Glycerophosphocholine cholinephosphodiesterase ENPP6 [Frankliniella fusca]